MTNFGKYNITTYSEPDYYVKSTEFPQYDGVIPQMNTKFISYDLELVGLENLLCFSTRLESTTAVFSYGHDLFYARVNPEANFDRLFCLSLEEVVLCLEGPPPRELQGGNLHGHTRLFGDSADCRGQIH